MINQLGWHLHELDSSWELGPGSLDWISACDKRPKATSRGPAGLVAGLARAVVQHLRRLTLQINALREEITDLVNRLASSLLTVPGCGALTAAKILGETDGIGRFKSDDAYTRHNASLRCRSGRPAMRGTGSAAPATGSSTRQSTGSR